jgi:hypothetical protein
MIAKHHECGPLYRRDSRLHLLLRGSRLRNRPDVLAEPVDAAKRTSVRSRRARWSTKALISAAVSTSGVLRRFAPWRTNRVGLQLNSS